MWSPRENPLREKSFAFSVRIVKVSAHLKDKKKECVMSKQLLKSGTSIGANIEEALQAQSKKDFIAKLHISLKEGFETRYWIRLLHETSYLTALQFSSLMDDIGEVLKLLTATIKTAKSRAKR